MTDNKWEELVVSVDNIGGSVEKYCDDVEGFYNNLHEKIQPIFGKNKHYTILGQIITKKNLQSVFLPHKNDFKDYISKTTEGRYSDVLKKFLFEKNNRKSEVFVLNSRQEIEDKTSLPKQFIEDNNINSLCVIPIHWENRIAGIIISFSKTKNAYQEDFEIFSYASKILSRTLKRRRDTNRKNYLLELSKTLSKSDEDNLNDKIFKILEKSYKCLDIYMSTKNVFMYCFDNTGIVDITLETKFNFGLVDKIKNESIPEKYSAIISMSNYIMKNHYEVINLETKIEIQEWLKKHDISGNIDDLESLLVTPMRVDTETELVTPMRVETETKYATGVYILFSTKQFNYDQSDCDFVNEISDQAAIIIQDLIVRQKLESIIENNKKILSDMNLQTKELYKVIYKNSTDFMDVSNMYIAEFDIEKNEINFPLFYLNNEYTRMESRKFGKGRTEWVIENKSPLIIYTKEESIEWYKKNDCTDYMENPFASWIGVPIMVNDKVLGIIAAFHEEKDYIYDEQDLEILDLFASQVALALNNAALYKKLEESSLRIAETQDILTKALIANDLVHRLNNLAAPIPMWADLCYEELNNADINRDNMRENLSEIVENAENILGEAKKLKQPEVKSDISIKNMLEVLIRQTIIQYRSEIHNGYLTIQHNISQDLYSTFSISSKVSHAIYCIISNGVDAVLAKGKGNLIINAENFSKDSNEWINITIKDNGLGISEELINRVFEPYTSSKEGSGRGYGLWRTKRVIEELGGCISFDSSNDGTVFSILLPKSNQVNKNE